MAFIKTKLVRGFTEISELFKIATENDAIICGGYARYCASPLVDPVKSGDIDLFPTKEESYEKLKAIFLADGLEIGTENDVSMNFRAQGKNEKWKHCPKIQIIKPMKKFAVVTIGSAEEILNNFDFTVVRACIISSTEVLVDENFLVDESRKRLVIKNIHCPVSSMLRCMKYSRKGYFLRPMEALKLFQDWSMRCGDYRSKLINFLTEAGKFDPENPDAEGGLTKEEVEELEAMMMID